MNNPFCVVRNDSFFGRGETKGFLFTRIELGEKSLIWHVNTGRLSHYEVWRRRINRRFDVESKPSAKSFGLWAWTYHDLDKAQEKFNSLEKKLRSGQIFKTT